MKKKPFKEPTKIMFSNEELQLLIVGVQNIPISEVSLAHAQSTLDTLKRLATLAEKLQNIRKELYGIGPIVEREQDAKPAPKSNKAGG